VLNVRVDRIDLDSRRSASAPLEYDDVHRALGLIDSVDARIVRFRHFDFLGLAEISARLGVSVGCVKVRYYRSLKRLREILEPEYRRDGW
jgi:DNA-directed RNA polymerase specialized sigma24 family protein